MCASARSAGGNTELRPYLNNLLIRHAGHEQALLVLVRVELDAVRDLPVGEAGDTLACGGR